MKKIMVITPADAAGGFGIAGVLERQPAAPGNAALIDSATADAGIGVLAIDERLVDAPARLRLREIEQQWRGVLVVLPAPSGAVRVEDDYARRLIRRAIGYQVKVQL